MKFQELNKKLILFGLIVSLFLVPTFLGTFSSVVYATEVEEAEVEESKEITTEKHVLGSVNRADTLEYNKTVFSEEIMSVAKVVFAFMVFIMIIMIGINGIMHSYDGKSRAEMVEKFKHIIYGVLLFSIAALIVTIATEFQQNLIESLYDEQYEDIATPEAIEENLETNWIANIIEMFFKIIGRILEYLIQLLFSVITLDGSNILNAANPAESEYNLNNILFLSNLGDSIDLNAENAYGVKLTTAPFSTKEWGRYTSAYFLLTSVSVPLMLIALLKSAFGMIVNAGNFEKVMDVKKTTLRICLGILIVAFGPYLFRGVLTFFNMLVYLIPVKFEVDIIMEDIDSANGLLSVLTSLWWLWIKFRIMLLFVVREIMLTVMYISTPVVIGLWAVSEKTQAFNRWLGETMTNAATQFCYAMVFFMATVILHGAQTNAFFTLLWLSMMLKLANFFKESFQGLFSKWGGVDESGVADGMAGKITGFGTTAVKATLDTLDPERYSRTGRAITNVLAFEKGVKTGDVGGFVTRGKVNTKLYKELKTTASDNAKEANAISGSEIYKNAVKNPGAARTLFELYSQIDSQRDVDGNIMSRTDLAAANARVEEILKNNAQDPGVQVVQRVRALGIDAQKKREEALRIEKMVKSEYKQEFVKGINSRISDRLETELSKRSERTTENPILKPIYSANTQGILNSTATDSEKRDMLFATEKLGGLTPPPASRSTVMDRMISSGASRASITDESLIGAVNSKIKEVNSNIVAAKGALEIQKNGSGRSLPDEIKKKQISNTNEQVERCVHSIAQLYKDGYFVGENPKLANKVNSLVKEVEYNGDYELAKKLREELSVIGEIEKQSSKL